MNAATALRAATGGVRMDVRAYFACKAAGLPYLRESCMLKVAAIVIAGLSLVACAGNVAAVEMAVTSGDFAHSGSGGGSDEGGTAAATRNVEAMRESVNRDSLTIGVERMQPDSATAARTDSIHAALGTDASASPTGLPAHKHQNAHWQSLLPGVMK